VALASGSVAAGDAAYSRTLTQIETTAEMANGAETANQTAGGTVRGGDDTIMAGNGNNVIFGGLGADSITAGNQKALILLGHVVSEQAGMLYCADWLRSFVSEVPIEFIATREPFWFPSHPVEI